MAKLVLSDITGLTQATAINANAALIEAAFENTLSRDGTTPNQMDADIDMNSYNLNNVGNITASGAMSADSLAVTTLTLGGTQIIEQGNLESVTVSSTWEKLESGSIPAAQSLTVTWDESAYDEIVIVIKGARTSSDNDTLYLQCGYNDGASILTGAGEYDGIYNAYSSTSWINQPSNDRSFIATACGDQVDETISVKIVITNHADANAGANVKTELSHKNASAALVNYNIFTQVKASQAIDTAKIAFLSGTFAAGTYAVYGLSNA